MEFTHLLIENFGERYSETLRIILESGDEAEIFRWFLASILFGAPIRGNSAINTYRCFERHGVLTPQRVLETGWHGLVKILDEGGYTRYDYKTSDKLLEVMGNLIDKYGGSLNLLHGQALDSEDLERRLRGLGKGIGNATVSIFLRELRGVWSKADPKPTPLVVLAAKNLGMIKREESKEALTELKDYWKRNEVAGETFVNLETALLRVGKDLCRRNQCKGCKLRSHCSTAT